MHLVGSPCACQPSPLRTALNPIDSMCDSSTVSTDSIGMPAAANAATYAAWWAALVR
jgi:hypothetical protein